MRNKAEAQCVARILVLLMFSASLVPALRVTAAEDPVGYFALIVCGYSGSFHCDTDYMLHVLTKHYYFDNITYLSFYGDAIGVNGTATKESVRAAISTTLAGWSDENDIVLIYISSHGGGYNVSSYSMEDGRWDTTPEMNKPR